MSFKFSYLSYFLFSLILGGCIGTDIVEQEMVPARVEITRKATSIKVGDIYQFQAQYFDELGNVVETEIIWATTDPDVISIDNSGLATANSAGAVTVSASANQATDMLQVDAGDITIIPLLERTGNFNGNRDYEVTGSFTLAEVGGDLQLSFSDEFTASNGPGLYVYLTNSQSSVSGGVELGKLKSNSGAQTYETGEDVQLGTYDYVLIYCKPFGIAFGIGKFDE